MKDSKIDIITQKTKPKFYSRLWSAVKNGTSKALNFLGKALDFLGSNKVSLTMGSIGLALTPITGPIGFGIAVTSLALKTAKASMDVVKIRNERKLLEENKALAEYAAAIATKNTLLDMCPEGKRDIVKKHTSQNVGDNKLSSKEKVEDNKVFNVIHKITGIASALSSIAGIAANPAGLVNAVKGAKNSVQTLNAARVGLGQVLTANASKNLAKTLAQPLQDNASADLTKALVKAFADSPKVKQDLIKAINDERGRADTGYNNIKDLKEQTLKIQKQNQVIKNLLQDTDFLTNSKNLADPQKQEEAKRIGDNFKKNEPIIQEIKEFTKRENPIKLFFKDVIKALRTPSAMAAKTEHADITKGQRAANISQEQEQQQKLRSQSIIKVKEENMDVKLPKRKDSFVGQNDIAKAAQKNAQQAEYGRVQKEAQNLIKSFQKGVGPSTTQEVPISQELFHKQQQEKISK